MFLVILVLITILSLLRKILLLKNKLNRIKVLQKKRLKLTRRRKSYLKNRNRKINLIKKSVVVKQRKINKFKRHDISVPPDFSLITNREPILRFFNQVKGLDYTEYTNIFFDFTNVVNISHGAITILLSICGWLADRNLKVFTNSPYAADSKKFFHESGFLNYFQLKYGINNIISDNAILQKGSKETEAELTSIHIRKAMKTVWGISYRNTKLQGMLIEMMANAINHAYNNNEKGWYFALHHLPNEHIVRFCFVDNGKGIINSLKSKLQRKLIMILSGESEGDMLIKAFDGQYGSSTQLTFRGRGLPLIKKNQTENVINNLKVISNNVFLDFATGEVTKLHEHFEGTFYYWELDENCKLWPLK